MYITIINYLKKNLLLLLTILCAGMLASCSDDATSSKEQKGTPLIILDTDIGSSTDDLFAMEMLYEYQRQGRCTLLGIIVDRQGQEYAALADVMNTYFGYPDLPIALIRQGIPNPKIWIDYKDLPNYTHPDGTPMFSRTLTDYSTLPDGWQLYRQLLAAQPDHSVTICSNGFVCALTQLIQSGPDTHSPLNGVELVRHKVKCIYMMGGVFGDAVEPIEYNFAQGVEHAQTFFNLWPDNVDIIMSPGEVGDGVEYKPEQVIADIDWTDAHPIKQVYMRCNCNTGQKMWDVLPTINAVEGNDQFPLSERGLVTVSSKGETFFTSLTTGNIRYQLLNDATWAATLLGKIRDANKTH